MSERQLVPDYYEGEACYCSSCGNQLEIDERFQCSQCEESEMFISDENLFL